MATSHRALLVEFVNADQHPGRVAFSFPMLRGFLAREGVPTRWVRFALSTTNLLVNDRDEVTLGGAELAALATIVRDQRPTLVLLTDRLYEAQVDALRALAPDLHLVVVGADDPVLPGLPAYRGMRELDDPAFVPGYDWEPGNAAALAKEIDNVYLVTRETCGYSARVSANPSYEGCDDPRVLQRQGCAFCSNRSESSAAEGRADPAWLVRQIRAAALRTSPDAHPGALLLTRVERAAVLEACAEALADTGLIATTQLLVGMRADHVDGLASFARAWFARCPDSPLHLGVYACGIESFVDEDLERFNKGLTSAQGLHAVETLRALAAELPDRFWYSGLTFILFTPWTTLDTLRTNVDAFVRLQFVEARNVFESRLRLHPGLAITALAERDGLLVDDEPDPLLVMNRRKLFESELPWRFVDPRVRPVCQLALRFDVREGVAADPLTLAVRRALAERRLFSAPLDRLRFLQDLVEVAAARGTPFEPADLLAEGLARYRQRSPRPPTDAAPVDVPSAPRAEPPRLRRLVDALVHAVATRPDRFAALTLQRLEPAADGAARLRARVDGRACELTVTEPRPGQPCLFRTHLFAVSTSAATPVDADDQQRLQRMFQVVERALLGRAAKP